MKIVAINAYRNKNIYFTHKSQSDNENIDNNRHNIALITLGACAVGFVGALIYKNSKTPKCITNNILETNKQFYEKIVKGLAEFGIDCKIEDLTSIVAPNEFSKLIRKFKPEHFIAGKQVSEKSASKFTLENFSKMH